MKSPMLYPFSISFKSPDSGGATSTNYHYYSKKTKNKETASCKNTLFLLTLNSERALSHDFFHALAHILECHKQKEVNVQTAGLSCQGSSLICIITPHIVVTKHYELKKNVNFTSWQSCDHHGCWSPPQSCWTTTYHRINVNAIVCITAVNAGYCSFKTCFFFFFPLLVSWSMQFRWARALWPLRKKNRTLHTSPSLGLLEYADDDKELYV